MKRWCILAVSTVAGYAGWWLADAAGLGFFAAFCVSGAASVAGVYLGWKLVQRFE
jgi:hypothetical protein